MCDNGGDSVNNYIRQVIPKPYYSETFTKEFSVNAVSGILEVNFDYMKYGARLIHLHSFIIDFGALSAVLTCKLIDNFGNVILSTHKTPAMTGIFPIDFIINSGQIKLQLIFSAPLDKFEILATAQYQYITDKAIPNK
jgi:hypothetical protein